MSSMPPTGSLRTPSTQGEIEEFVVRLEPRLAAHARTLRAILRETVPSAIERIRPGWGLIGYDLPLTRRATYFAWIWPQPEHIHIGFEVGTLMRDPDGRLQGAHLKLKRVRYLTFGPTDRVDRRVVAGFVREAARVASMSRAERSLLALSTNGS
jgi:hypothetical protein